MRKEGDLQHMPKQEKLKQVLQTLLLEMLTQRIGGWQDMDKRKKLKQMEVLWRGAESYGADADVFTGNFPSGQSGTGLYNSRI